MKTILSIQSHVSFGYVGNRAAVFPLQRMGYDVIAVNTVQFSNHTGYGQWTGDVFSPTHIEHVLQGIKDRQPKIDALLTGYIGDAAIGKVALEAIDIFGIDAYCCDPVMGDVGRGIFVRDGIPEFFRQTCVPRATIATPNQFELGLLSGMKTESLDDIRAACQKLHERGTQILLVTSLAYEGLPQNQIQILASHKDGRQWIITTPKLQFDPAPNGAGDCTAALFLGHILSGQSVDQALEKTAASIFAVFEETKRAGSRELALIQAQSALALPPHQFKAIRL